MPRIWRAPSEGFAAGSAAAGFDAAKVKWIIAGSDALPGLLASNRVPCVGQFTVGEPLLAAAIAPKKLVRLAYRDVGLDYYGNGIVASENLIAKEPGMLLELTAVGIKPVQVGVVDRRRQPCFD